VNLEEPLYFSKDNTILVDDSLQKSVLNKNKNAIFLESWDRHIHGNKVLLETLSPWLKQLHEECQPDRQREFVDANQIGQFRMIPNSFRTDLLLDGLRESTRNFGSHYMLSRMNLVINLEGCRK